MLMVLGAAIGSGELLAEPAAGARYGGALFWAIPFIIITKALWNEAIGRVAIVTGQNFLESCSGAGPLVVWVPWAWYLVNVLKDFLLRGGIAAIAGLICFDTFGPLPPWLASVIAASTNASGDQLQMISWTLLNYAVVWLLLMVGGYRLAEAINAALCVMFTLCLVACAASVLPQAGGELARGLLPRVPAASDELLMLIALAGIVMSGSSTIYYSAWAEERAMGLFACVRATGRRLARWQIEPESEEEVRRMAGWLRVNRLNVAVTYFLGALICLSTFVLGVAVLRPAGVTLSGKDLAPELSLMMTQVVGPWAKPVFYAGAYAAMISTTIGILDGGSRMYAQPLRRILPAFLDAVSKRFSADAGAAKATIFSQLVESGFRVARSFVEKLLSPAVCHRVIMTLMVVGCWLVYVRFPDALKLVLWMGAIDAPLVGILMVAYAYLCNRYLPRPYRRGAIWTLLMVLIGIVYFSFGAFYAFQENSAS